MTNDEKIQLLQDEERHLRTQLAKNIEKQREINTKLWVEKYGVNIGDRVYFELGVKCYRGVIHKFKFMDAEIYHVEILLLNKDDKPGSMRKVLFSYEFKHIKKHGKIPT